MVQNIVVDIDAIDIESVKKYMDNNSSRTHRKYNNLDIKQLKSNVTLKRIAGIIINNNNDNNFF